MVGTQANREDDSDHIDNTSGSTLLPELTAHYLKNQALQISLSFETMVAINQEASLKQG